MYEIGHMREGKNLRYLETGQYTYLAGEINALYHEAAVKMGISDSIQNILYVLCEKGGKCLQSEISKLTGISRQTINSAIRKLEKEEIVYLEQGKGRNLASIALAVVKIPKLEKTEQEERHFIAEIKEGLQVFKEDKKLFYIVIAEALCMFFYAPLLMIY